MGAVHFSLDERLIEELQRIFPLPVLVETGTFQGETLASARPHFARAYSVELVEEQYRRAAGRFAGDDGVTVRCGDSAVFLHELRPMLAAESVLYWLDAHWCGGTGVPPPGDGHDQCPLLRELGALESLNDQSVVLIDDARYFLAPPPPPNDPDQWPRFDEVVDGLRALSAGHEMLIVNDVIIFHPRAARDRLRAFAAQYGVDASALVALAAAGQRSRDEMAAAQRDTVALERLCAELQAAAAERLEVLEKLHRDYVDMAERCAEFEKAAAERLELLQAMTEGRLAADERCAKFEKAAAERLELLQAMTEDRLAADERCAKFEKAAAERLELLQAMTEDRLAADERCAKFEKAAAERLELLQAMTEDRLMADERGANFEYAAAQRLLLLEDVSARNQALEERVKLFEAALQQRDRRIRELERVLDQRSLELEGLRGGRHRPT